MLILGTFNTFSNRSIPKCDKSAHKENKFILENSKHSYFPPSFLAFLYYRTYALSQCNLKFVRARRHTRLTATSTNRFPNVKFEVLIAERMILFSGT